jgi:hypothetical protein
LPELRTEERVKTLTRTPVTVIERDLIGKFTRCRFPVASWPKRFAKNVDAACLTEKQRYWLARLCMMYRRQIRFSPAEFSWCVDTGKFTHQELGKMRLTPPQDIAMPLFEESAR